MTAEMVKITEQHQKQLVRFSADTKLIDSDIFALCFAVLVAGLEECLGVDPFSNAWETGFPATLGDIVRAYENGSG
jgi:hypothetical protein